MSDCGKYLIVPIVKACRDNLLYFADLEKNGPITGKIPLTPIVTEFEADYDVNISKSTSLCEFCDIFFLMYFFSPIDYSMSPTLDQKWCSAPIKMHQTIV